MYVVYSIPPVGVVAASYSADKHTCTKPAMPCIVLLNVATNIVAHAPDPHCHLAKVT